MKQNRAKKPDRSTRASDGKSARLESAEKSLAQGDLVKALKTARDGLSKLHGRYTEYLYPYLQLGAGAAKALVKDADELKRLEKTIPRNRKYKRPKLDSRNYEDVVRVVLEFMFLPADLEERRTVNRYARALIYLDSEGADSNEISARLRSDGGIENITKKLAQRERAKKPELGKPASPSVALSFAGRRFLLSLKKLKKRLDDKGVGQLRLSFSVGEDGQFRPVGEPTIVKPKNRTDTIRNSPNELHSGLHA